MDYQNKLKLIQSYSHTTQTQLAKMLAVSFPTLNSWLHKKSQPRQGALLRIDALYIEYVGNLEIDNQALIQKHTQLSKLKKRRPDSYALLMSRRDIYNSFLLEMTYHSNGIEGNTFNEPEVKAVLFDDVTIPNKSVLEHQEAKNHQAALGFVMRWLKDEKRNITESLIKKIHEILMNGIMYNAGQYRTHKVRIAGSLVATANPQKIEENMRTFIESYNAAPQDVVFHIAQTHAQFEQIHPFTDGNGRVGRLLILVTALQNGYAPVLIKKEKKLAYYNCLQESQMNGNHLPLVAFMYEALFQGYELLEE
jgi:Fic family protein